MSQKIRRALGRERALAENRYQQCSAQWEATPPPWNDISKANFQAFCNKMKTDVEKMREWFSKWDDLCEAITDEAEAQDEEARYNEWWEKPEYGEFIDKMEVMVERIQCNMNLKAPDTPQPWLDITQTENTGYSSDQSSPPRTLSTVPPLNLPKFDGDYLKWNSFWQRFDHSIHSKPYPAIEKLISLFGYLEGRALEEVEGFEIAEENYDTVVNTLIDRFGKRPLIIKELQAKLRKIEPAKSNAESLRSTVNMICNMCRQLENLGVNIDNDSMKMDIIEKLPYREKEELNWLVVSEPETTTVEEIMKRMKSMALRAELAPKNQTKISYDQKPSESQQKQFIQKPNNKIFEHAKKQGFTCSFCEGSHKSSKCEKFASPEQKLKQLQAKNCCTKCTNKNHQARDCLANIKCGICGNHHYSFLCKTNTNQSSAFSAIEKKQGMLLTKEVIVMNPDTKEITEAVVLFDSGSQQSYVSEEIIQKLNLKTIQEETLHVVGFGAKTTKYNSSVVKLQLKTNHDLKEIMVNSTKNIATTVPVVQTEIFESINIKTVYKKPDILIGMDYFFDFVTSFEKTSDNHYIVNSTVGKMIGKQVQKIGTTTVSSLAIEHSSTVTDDDNDLQRFWNLEDMGIKDVASNEKENSILEKFKQNVKFENNRYYVSWPEKEEHDELPSNAGLAFGRLKSMLKKLSNEPKLMEDCEKIIRNQVERGTVEVAPQIPQGKLVHYLAPQAVITPQKTTTKIRIVFDASAKMTKLAPSLNDCFIRGPLNMPDLGGILLRIRTAKYMLIGDIEKAFHQVYLNEPDRDAVRFFWVKNPKKPMTNDNIISYRFIGVPFGVISSPFILWIIILLHLQKLKNENLQKIDENFYVDNIFLLVDDQEEGIQQFKTIRNHFLQASMNIREWLSNDKEINEAFPKDIRQENLITKVLGLNWNTESDTLQIQLKAKDDSTSWTKRKVLQFIASTFDPLGFLSPVTVKGRIFMQKLFKEKLTWDESLKEGLLEEWEITVKNWKGSIEIPRKYVKHIFPDTKNIEIHAFADASQQAYCTCVYLKIQTENAIETPLVFAKTRLQPLNKKLTIPKLEIMGIWLAAKIISYVAKQMKLESCEKFIWTDSQISYYWFQKSPKDIFVSNRLKEVLQSNATCLFIPGKINPADLGTRGLTFEELQKADNWWKGPPFLKQKRKEWPKSPQFGTDLTQTITALVAITETTTLQNLEIIRDFEIDPNMELSKLKQVVAEKQQQKQPQQITVADLKAAEKILIGQEQQIYIKPKDEKQFKLSKDNENLFRLNCRFDHAELVNSNPIFLPKNSPLTRKIIQELHQKLHHAGIPHTLSKIREEYWIPSGRETVKKVIGKCKSCKYWKGKSFALPKMPNLPSTRVNKTKPFQNVGIDYCGPFKVKGEKEKVWISLFTCFTTRLIHLEPVSSMNSEEFLLAFRRFIARRGTPEYILSDNAKQFKTAATALDKLWESAIKEAHTVKYCNENKITWDYITERAPWKGGLYERLVGLVKNALKQTIGRQFINLNEFGTFLTEIEATINSRPLTYVHSQEPFVIRPIDFVSPGIQINLPTVPAEEEIDDETYIPSNACGGERLAEQYKKSINYLNKFWNLWNKDYLNFLKERNVDEHRNRRGAIRRSPRVDETVLVFEPDIARGLWKTATVKELITSSDNEIRSVKIEYKDGFVTKRAVNHLYPIEEGEINFESETDNQNLHTPMANNENHSVVNLLSIPPQSSINSFSSPSTKSQRQSEMVPVTPPAISLEDVSSASSTSVTEVETLRKEMQQTRRAETILRKTIKNVKGILRDMIDEQKDIADQLEERLGKGMKAGDLIEKLQQLNNKIINTIKARDAAFEELKEVRDENKAARLALNNELKK